MTHPDLCRDIAMEAVRRGARANVHELWALLELIDELKPRLVVDVGSGPAEWWAWWSLCPEVIGVSATTTPVRPAFSGPFLPSGVTALTGHPMDASTALRVADQIARRPVDVVVIGSAASAKDGHWLYHTYARHVRDGGMVFVHGIANPATPGMRSLWRDLVQENRKELIGETDPDGYGVLMIPRKVNSNG